MFSFLKPKMAKKSISEEEIPKKYKSLGFQSLAGIFLGYMAYYIIRNNFALSTPYLQEELHLSSAQIGFLSSTMLIAYGISKGIMSSLADKASPKKFMAFGLLMAAMVNIMLGFGTAFWVFMILVIILGLFQGMGVGPSYITLAHWIPHKRRGTLSAVWNISHNVGGGIAAPIVGFGFAMFGSNNWQIATYQIPAAVAIIFAMIILLLVKERPKHEGLPPINEYSKEEANYVEKKEQLEESSEDRSFWYIFKNYALKNKNVWYTSFADACNYMVRYGVLSWLPIYLIQVKQFSQGEMSVAFFIFEWAAIPSTLLAGYISDKIFKGYRMPPAVIALVIIFLGIIGYWQSNSLVAVTLFAAIVGCLIYVPMFLVSVQAVEVVPPFAVGASTGLRGFISYIFGASAGTTIFGIMIDTVGWHGGFLLLLSAAILGIIFCSLIDLSMKKQNRLETMSE
ncbi:MFS transporter [Oceanobacillus timonensis]|uniref:MFS transporter n=1 Tax=Oceanobacillus timonensis TaxID=1926285 RepID=UPI0009B94963|nr:MFS transporter [Oceanobacillus timonensis]